MPQKTVIDNTKPQSDVLCKYNTRFKEFPEYVKVTCFSKPVFNPHGVERHKSQNELEAEASLKIQRLYEKQIEKELIEIGWMEKPEKSQISRSDSIKRAKDKAYEIAYANEFEYFVTFTLDPEKINRYEAQEILKVFKNWLDNTSRRQNMKYLIFPELHKDGAIHFHGLITGGTMTFVDSGKKTEREQVIYNLKNWTLGFSTAVKVDSERERLLNYVMKYITKDNKRVFGKHYFAGGGVIRELPTSYQNLDFIDFDAAPYSIPQAAMLVKYKTIPKEEDVNNGIQ